MNDGPAYSEHLAVATSAPLVEFCTRLHEVLGLPPFRFQAENETEWGSVVVEGLEYNVSRPLDPGSLHEWDESVPQYCTLGISLIVHQDHAHARSVEWAAENVVPGVAEAIAAEFATVVFYHRSWRGVGKNIVRSLKYKPGKA